MTPPTALLASPKAARARPPAGPPAPSTALPPRPATRRHRGREWQEAQADARALSSSLDPLRLFAGLLIVADGVVIVLAAAIAFLLRYGPVAPPPHVLLATVLALLIMISLRRGSDPLAGSLPTQLVAVLRCWSLAGTGLLVAAWLFRKTDDIARLWGTAWFVLALVGFAAVRLAAAERLASWRRRGRLSRIVAIVDLDGAGRALARRLQGVPAGEMRLLGVFVPAAADAAGAPASSISDLVALSQLFRIDDVLVTTSWPGTPALPEVLRRLAALPTTVRLCPVLPDGLPPTAAGGSGLVLGNPTLVVSRRPLPGWHVVAKRIEDLVLGGLALAALSPVMLVIAALVRLDSPGPALFRQQRLGFNNKPITVFKFRSMTDRPEQEPGVVAQARRHDPRVTRLGRVLRRSSLDELPQLFNVLRGEMSLVGPRPHAIAHNVQYAALIDDYLGRHRVQPGITGWAQVNGLRGETDTLDKMQRRVEFDLAYIERWSLLFDLRIIVQTALGVFFHKAY